MLQAFEGIYRNSVIELLEFPDSVLESRVLITFLTDSPAPEATQSIRFGMFSGATQSSEVDFELARFKGNNEKKQ